MVFMERASTVTAISSAKASRSQYRARAHQGRTRPAGTISNEADFIFVEGDKVSLYVSGVDFPATAKCVKAV
jgi:hypothetical protein